MRGRTWTAVTFGESFQASLACWFSNKMWSQETGGTRTKFKPGRTKDEHKNLGIRCCHCLVVQTDDDKPVSTNMRASWVPEDCSESQERQQGTGNHRSSATKEKGLERRRKTRNREHQSTCSSHIRQPDPNSRKRGMFLNQNETKQLRKRKKIFSHRTWSIWTRRKAGLKWATRWAFLK